MDKMRMESPDMTAQNIDRIAALFPNCITEMLDEEHSTPEKKGSMSSMQLRLIEESKIHCAREHFKAISNGNVVYDVVDSYQTLLEKVMK